MENQVQGRAVCTNMTHNHETLEAAGNCGDPMTPSGRPALPIAGVTLAAPPERPAMSDVFDQPEVRSRMRIQYDAQLRILERIADEIEFGLSDNASTEVFRQRFHSLVAETTEQRDKWS